MMRNTKGVYNSCIQSNEHEESFRFRCRRQRIVGEVHILLNTFFLNQKVAGHYLPNTADLLTKLQFIDIIKTKP